MSTDPKIVHRPSSIVDRLDGPPNDGRSTHDRPSTIPQYRPRERFWPYVELPEQLTDEEIARLDPDLHAELFGTPPRPLSITLVFPVLDSPDYARALELARASAEYRETGSGTSLRHRARFWPSQAVKLRELFELVGRSDDCDVLVDDRPIPYARELWLPLIWFLIPR